MSANVFVTVGSEHYPFDRLVSWMDEWFATRTSEMYDCFIQYGVSSPPSYASGEPFLPYPEIQQAIRTATVVVTHGGTGSIMLARHLGKRPIVVPRLRRLGEHVDDHQVSFARRLADSREIELAGTADELQTILTEALEGRLDMTAVASETGHNAVQTFTELVSELMDGRERGR